MTEPKPESYQFLYDEPLWPQLRKFDQEKIILFYENNKLPLSVGYGFFSNDNDNLFYLPTLQAFRYKISKPYCAPYILCNSIRYGKEICINEIVAPKWCEMSFYVREFDQSCYSRVYLKDCLSFARNDEAWKKCPHSKLANACEMAYYKRTFAAEISLLQGVRLSTNLTPNNNDGKSIELMIFNSQDATEIENSVFVEHNEME